MAEEKKFKAVIEVGGGIGSSLKTAFATLRGNTKQLGDSLKSLKSRARELSLEMGKGLGGPGAARSLASVNAQIQRTERNIVALNRIKAANVGGALGAVGSQLRSSALMIATATGAAAAGIVALGKSVGDYADNAAEAASSVGMGTNELIRYKYAADDVGTGAETLEKSLAKMQLSLEKARKDGGGNVFALLRLDARKLSRQAPGKQLEAIAEAFSKYQGKVSKTAIAMALFGKSGSQMVNFLSLGKKGLAEYGQEAEALGLTISDSLIEKGDEFGRTQLRVGAALSGLKNNLAQGLLPVMNQLGNEFANFVKEHPDKVKKFGEDLGTALKNASEAAKSFGKALEANGPQIKEAIESIGGLKTVLLGLAAIQLAPVVTAVVSLGFALKSLAVGLGAVAIAGAPLWLVVVAIAAVGHAIYQAWKNWDDIKETWQDGLEWFKGAWFDLGQSAEAFANILKGKLLSAFAAIKADAAAKFAWLGEKLSAIGEAFGKVKGWFGGSDSAKPADAPTVDGARAMGGPVSAGKRYLVGERGPEIFAPRSSGQIIPNGGGKSDNRTFNFTINAAPGMNERTLADLVIARLNGRQAALAGGALYD
jgi:hypothetical protein